MVIENFININTENKITSTDFFINFLFLAGVIAQLSYAGVQRYVTILNATNNGEQMFEVFR